MPKDSPQLRRIDMINILAKEAPKPITINIEDRFPMVYATFGQSKHSHDLSNGLPLNPTLDPLTQPLIFATNQRLPLFTVQPSPNHCLPFECQQFGCDPQEIDALNKTFHIAKSSLHQVLKVTYYPDDPSRRSTYLVIAETAGEPDSRIVFTRAKVKIGN